jgi:hypothetical protein
MEVCRDVTYSDFWSLSDRGVFLNASQSLLINAYITVGMSREFSRCEKYKPWLLEVKMDGDSMKGSPVFRPLKFQMFANEDFMIRSIVECTFTVDSAVGGLLDLDVARMYSRKVSSGGNWWYYPL